MSRSIHTTRRSVAQIRAKVLKAELPPDEIPRALQRLRRKRLTKKSVREERHRQIPSLPRTTIDSLRVESLSLREPAMHGLDRGDILEILSRLPQAAREGISRIQLSLGKAHQLEICATGRSCAAPDPFFERPGFEFLPGVYSGRVLGVFSPNNGLIRIFAFVVDQARSQLPAEALRLYLKLHSLKTLVHEVAHHHDEAERVARGRWLADRTENAEHYAEGCEHRWTQDVVIPYLESKFPKETSVLRHWVLGHAGILPDLRFFAGDPRRTKRSGRGRPAACTAEAFEGWLCLLPNFHTPTEIRLGFARELYSARAYTECLAVVDALLATETEASDALRLRADALVGMNRLDDAWTLAEALLTRNAGDSQAWKTRGHILEKRLAWNDLLANCERWLALPDSPTPARCEALAQRAVAFCALGLNEDLNQTLQTIVELGSHKADAVALRKRLENRLAAVMSRPNQSSPAEGTKA